MVRIMTRSNANSAMCLPSFVDAPLKAATRISPYGAASTLLAVGELERSWQRQSLHLAGIEILLNVLLGENKSAPTRSDSAVGNLSLPGKVVHCARSYSQKLCNLLHLVGTHDIRLISPCLCGSGSG